MDIQELLIAYRKAKVDLYYSTHSDLTAIADYEENLLENLKSLLDRIEKVDESWIEKEDFLGSWILVPKSIKIGLTEEDNIIFSSTMNKYKTLNPGADKEAVFRLMAQCSMDFHVLSSLWIMKVGCLFEEKLSGDSYGNRLRRKEDRSYNNYSLGSFQHYLKPFRDWRDEGIKVMREAMEDNKRITVLTADFDSFYHRLNPDFMLSQDFQEKIGLRELTKEEDNINRLFINAIKSWAEKTPIKGGLPVGLPSSAIIANMALWELDKTIREHVSPLYYGRYVDDIILVIENNSDFQSQGEFWGWLEYHTQGILSLKENEQIKESIVSYQSDDVSNSKLSFGTKKTKLFFMEGLTGLTLIQAIENQIHQQASEWRSLPVLPKDAKLVATDLVAATNRDGERVDNLRKTDLLTMHRAGFAIKLREYEAFERDLPPKNWKSQRNVFFETVINHVLEPKKFFELELYIPRIFRLATSCEDFFHLKRMFGAVSEIINYLETSGFTLKIKASEETPNDCLTTWKTSLYQSLAENIISSFPFRLTQLGKTEWQDEMSELWKEFHNQGYHQSPTINDIQREHLRLFNYDLAMLPWRFRGLPPEMTNTLRLPRKKDILLESDNFQSLFEGIKEGLKILSRWLGWKGQIPQGLIFATRPFNLPELYLISPDPFSRNGLMDLKSVVFALRGFSLSSKAPKLEKELLKIPYSEDSSKRNIAVSSWKTDSESMKASIMKMLDPDVNRYRRTLSLINRVMNQMNDGGYLIFPELSIPSHWFIRIAKKLYAKRISFICGIEYLHCRGKKVHNQVWASLIHDGLGFPSLLLYCQDKQRPARHEEEMLWILAGLKLVPKLKPWKSPRIIHHGNLSMAFILCSEFTNIEYRSALRGKVDVLFIPEWNRDINSFNALVESAAMDIHAYIVQCNDRAYGDSRIRAPFTDVWKRDILKVKGGVYDYSVVGTIDIEALRAFQSGHRSQNGPFKPVPDGFQIDYHRKTMPKGDDL
jgi:hypothetical protein